jgi:hypothetical protein
VVVVAPVAIAVEVPAAEIAEAVRHAERVIRLRVAPLRAVRRLREYRVQGSVEALRRAERVVQLRAAETPACVFALRQPQDRTSWE